MTFPGAVAAGCKRNPEVLSDYRFAPAQIGIQASAAEQLLNVRNALVAWPFEVFQLQTRIFDGVKYFLGAFAGSPLRLEVWQDAIDLAEVHAVAAGVGAAVLGVFDLAAGNGFIHDFRQLADLIV